MFSLIYGDGILNSHLKIHLNILIVIERLRAFHREWYSTIIEGFVETSRFVHVNSICISRALRAVFLTFTPIFFILIDAYWFCYFSSNSRLKEYFIAKADSVSFSYYDINVCSFTDKLNRMYIKTSMHLCYYSTNSFLLSFR